MRKLKINIYHSHEEANDAYLEQVLAMKPEDRVAATDELRRRLYAIKGIKADNKVDRTKIRCFKRNKDGKEEPYE